MDRATLQRLAELRLEDAAALLAAERWDAAYYIVGYAVECALKACFVTQFREHQVPDRKKVNSFYTHDLNELLSQAGLREQFEEAVAADARLLENWRKLREWSEASRYEVDILENP